MQEEVTSDEGNVTNFAAALETIFGLSRDYGGIENVNPLQIMLTFQVRNSQPLTTLISLTHRTW